MKKEQQAQRMEQRKANFQSLYAKYEQEGYTAQELTIPILRANVLALLLFIPFLAAGLALYVFIWKEIHIDIKLGGLLLFFLLYLLSIVAHEGLHGITWRLFCKNGWKSIQFGIMDGIAPYCHCMEPLNKRQYLCGGLAPLAILGILFCGVALAIGHFILLLFGLLNIMGAGGDMAICLLLLRSKATLFLDHPEKCGFVAFTKPK